MKEIIPVEYIQKRIFIVRGQRVMLDKDLAQIYGIKPIRLREQVKRNKKRFPEDFMFRLTDKEVEDMVSQNAIPSRKYLGGSNPYVFTEHGAVMLAAVLNTPKAVEMSIFVVRAFIKLRQIIEAHKELSKRLEELEKNIMKHDAEIQALFEAIKQMMFPPEKEENKKKIGFI